MVYVLGSTSLTFTDHALSLTHLSSLKCLHKKREEKAQKRITSVRKTVRRLEHKHNNSLCNNCIYEV